MLGDRQREGENTEFVEQDSEKREWMHKTSIREKGQMLNKNCSTRRKRADIQSGFAMYKETGLALSQFCVCSIYINVGEIKYE